MCNMFGGFGNWFGGCGCGFGNMFRGGFWGNFGTGIGMALGSGLMTLGGGLLANWLGNLDKKPSIDDIYDGVKPEKEVKESQDSGNKEGEVKSDGTGNKDGAVKQGDSGDKDGVTINENASADDIKKLTEEELKKLSQETLKGLKPEQLQALTGSQIKSLTPEQLAALSDDQVKGLSIEQVNELNDTQSKILLMTIGLIDNESAAEAKLGITPAELKLLEISGLIVSVENGVASKDPWIKGKISNIEVKDGKVSYDVDCKDVEDATLNKKYHFTQNDDNTFNVKFVTDTEYKNTDDTHNIDDTLSLKYDENKKYLVNDTKKSLVTKK